MSTLYDIAANAESVKLTIKVGNKASFTEIRNNGTDEATWSLIVKGVKAMAAAAAAIPSDWKPPTSGEFAGMSRSRAQIYKLERLVRRLNAREAGEQTSNRRNAKAVAYAELEAKLGRDEARRLAALFGYERK